MITLGYSPHRQKHAACDANAEQISRRKLVAFGGDRTVDGHGIVMWLPQCRSMLITVIG
jgi:hypothetical protein